MTSSKTEYYGSNHILTSRSADTSIDLTTSQSKSLNINRVSNIESPSGVKINLDSDVYTFSIDGTNYMKIGKQDWASKVNTVSMGNNPSLADAIGQNQGTTLKLTAQAPANMLSCVAAASTFQTLVKFISGASIVGTIQTDGSSTSYNIISDETLKSDFKEIKVLDNIVANAKVYDFKYNCSDCRHIGVKAQELKNLIPQAVTSPTDDKEPYLVDYSKIVPILLQGLKEAYEKIKELELDIKLIKKSIVQ